MPLKDKCSEKSVNITSRLTKLDESNPSNTISVTPELEQQFEVELCWCIQQLKTALKTGKLNNKQGNNFTFIFCL